MRERYVQVQPDAGLLEPVLDVDPVPLIVARDVQSSLGLLEAAHVLHCFGFGCKLDLANFASHTQGGRVVVRDRASCPTKGWRAFMTLKEASLSSD